MTTLTVEHGPVTTVTLNRPAVRNAFNEELIGALADFVRRYLGLQGPADQVGQSGQGRGFSIQTTSAFASST